MTIIRNNQSNNDHKWVLFSGENGRTHYRACNKCSVIANVSGSYPACDFKEQSK